MRRHLLTKGRQVREAEMLNVIRAFNSSVAASRQRYERLDEINAEPTLASDLSINMASLAFPPRFKQQCHSEIRVMPTDVQSCVSTHNSRGPASLLCYLIILNMGIQMCILLVHSVTHSNQSITGRVDLGGLDLRQLNRAICFMFLIRCRMICTTAR